MKNKALKQEIEQTDLEKAQEIIQKESQKRVELFMKDYKEICLKHGMELVANPKVEWSVTPIQKPQNA